MYRIVRRSHLTWLGGRAARRFPSTWNGHTKLRIKSVWRRASNISCVEKTHQTDNEYLLMTFENNASSKRGIERKYHILFSETLNTKRSDFFFRDPEHKSRWPRFLSRLTTPTTEQGRFRLRSGVWESTPPYVRACGKARPVPLGVLLRTERRRRRTNHDNTPANTQGSRRSPKERKLSHSFGFHKRF